MIKKIIGISNFGTYINFKWNQQKTSNFKEYNFFYGWNYSGKTSLSRLFRCFELKQKHPDYQDLQFEIEFNNGNNVKNLEDIDLSVRVFNEDFIEENFKWNDENHKINPVLILGKENIALQNELKSKEEERQKKLEEKVSFEKDKKSLESQLSNSLTDKASNIRKILGVTNPKDFDKSKLEDKINKLIDNYTSKILTDNEEQHKLNMFRNQINYETISQVNINNKIKLIVENTNSILLIKITAQQIIDKLKDNSELNDWVRKGIDLHKYEKICQFCGNNLPKDLFERLNKHFSKEFDQLINEIDELTIEINSYKAYLEKLQFTDEARFFEEYQDDYKRKKKNLLKTIEKTVIKLNALTKLLENKRNKPFDVLEKIEDENLEDHFVNCLTELNKVIEQHNERIKNISKEKEDIKTELIDHYSAKVIQEIKLSYNNEELGFFEIKEKINELEKKVSEHSQLIDYINNEINKIKNDIARQNEGATKINEYLCNFFSDDQIKLKLLDDGTYQIYRNNKIAKNLSTGERNIISLIYFITKLEEDNFNKNEAIVFIDDPVSSLDSNHIFRIYGFLAEKVLYCKQVFITTHNFDFFNLLKDMVKSDPEGTPNRKSKKEKENFYLIKKIKSENDRISTIENLPQVLLKFKSEYNYLFSILQKFNNINDKSNFELLYLMPNIIRRFLEAYLFQKYPDGKDFKKKCDKFFKDEDKNNIKSTLKLLDEYSHEQNPEHANKFPDIQEVENSVSTIIRTLQKKDIEHYVALCDSIKN